MYLSKRTMREPAVPAWLQALPIAVCFIYFIAAVYAGQSYVVGSYDNSDFFSMYAPDAARIAAGDFPANTFNGPGYPLLLAAISALTGDHFIAGKWIAALAASLCGLVAFYLFQNLFGYRSAIFALFILLVSGEFARYSIDPGTDLIFLLLCLSAMLVFTHHRLGIWQKAALAGLIGGYAYLTRYNGVFLPGTFIIGIVIFDCLGQPLMKRLQLAAVHALCFLATISPWLWLNYQHHGSPLYNTNYLNMATEFYGYKVDWDGVMLAAGVFHNFGDVILHNPKDFLQHYLANIVSTFRKTLSGEFIVLPLGILAIAAMPLAVMKGPRKEVSLMLLSMLLYFLVMCFNHWEGRYYFFIMACYIGLASSLIVWSADRIARWIPSAHRLIQIAVLCAGFALFYAAAHGSAREIEKLVRNQPRELIGANEYLRSVSLAEPKIMARKPHLAYLSHGKQVFFPPAKTLEELHVALEKTPADFLVYDKISLALRPELKMLSESISTIPWLKPVYSDPSGALIIYRVEQVARQTGG